MAISEQDKRAIDEAVESLHSVTIHEEGYKSIEPFYPDYNDTNDFLLDSAYDNRKGADKNEIISALEETICEGYAEQTWDVASEILRQAGFEPSDEIWQVLLDYLQEEYVFEIPTDHYLSQDIQVNILLGGKEETNFDFALLRGQCDALSGKYSPEDTREALSQESGLSFLVKQQGYTMEQAMETVKAYMDFFYGEDADRSANYDVRYLKFAEGRDPFLVSLAQEVDNMSNYMSCVVVLAKMDMYQFSEMMKSGKEVIIPKDAMIGFFNPWIGSGSALDIVLKDDLVIPSDMIWDAQIEGAKLENQYSVDEVCGFVKSAWKQVKEVRDSGPEKPKPEKKAALDSIIQAAQTKAQNNMDKQGLGLEAQR